MGENETHTSDLHSCAAHARCLAPPGPAAGYIRGIYRGRGDARVHLLAVAYCAESKEAAPARSADQPRRVRRFGGFAATSASASADSGCLAPIRRASDSRGPSVAESLPGSQSGTATPGR